MNKKILSQTRRRRLDIQGFTNVEDDLLVEVGPWLRLTFGLCTVFAFLGIALTSTSIIWTLVPIAALGAMSPVHPFDLIYNLVIRRFTHTLPLPKRGAPSRFACGFGSVWLIIIGVLFHLGNNTAAYVLGSMLCVVGVLVSTIDF